VNLPAKEKHVVLSREDRQQKLRTLCEIEGFATIEELLEAASYDSVNPAICINPGCEYTAEMEPDQDGGHCEECGTKTVQSALVLAELI
jgi:hypothetical protein